MNILEMVVKMEKDSIKFYNEAAEKTKNPIGKKMFLMVADDEKRHLEMVSKIIKGMNIKPKDVSPLKTMKSLFENMKSEMIHKIEVSVDELEAFNVAMHMEQDGAEFYKNALGKAAKKKERALLERLVQEEQEHYQILSNTYVYLSNTQSWFLWEERAIIDGGGMP
jgi:rubrerythrin